MGDPRLKILIKGFLDLLYFALVFVVYLTSIFSYMKDYYVGTTEITYKYVDPTLDLDAKVIATYNQFDDNFCDLKTTVLKEVCDHREDWETAGIVFIVFSSVAHAVMAYGMLNLMGMLCGCTLWGFAKYEIEHYIYPWIYATAILLWIVISKVFDTSPPSGFGDSYDVSVQVGLVFMFSAFLVSVVGSVYFFWNRKDMRAILLVTQQGFTPAPPDK
ncbi:unnamed protein product [Blepharisma stoltei]|uniref:Uncharacterized protein n=1 Tax=Blepharisma stoltei TaxID=1481888 RepID=A0AAU9KA36_9CILI|nr:unnamed protein product [Blepharisma stoltei]